MLFCVLIAPKRILAVNAIESGQGSTIASVSHRYLFVHFSFYLDENHLCISIRWAYKHYNSRTFQTNPAAIYSWVFMYWMYEGKSEGIQIKWKLGNNVAVITEQNGRLGESKTHRYGENVGCNMKSKIRLFMFTFEDNWWSVLQIIFTNIAISYTND